MEIDKLSQKSGIRSEVLRKIIQLAKQNNVKQVILFGSRARGDYRERSDIDICVIAETTNKRELLTDLYCEIDSEKPVDFLLYTPEEWNKNIEDAQSFAYKLDREGMLLYER